MLKHLQGTWQLGVQIERLPIYGSGEAHGILLDAAALSYTTNLFFVMPPSMHARLYINNR
jgi:hypothetical protein